MTTKTPLPLSQQILAWCLGSMGLSGEVSISKSSVKSAQRGDIVPNSWADLLASFISVWGVDPSALDLEQLAAFLRAYDGRVSSLAAPPLSLEQRLPAVLRLLGPVVGVRLGALASMVDGGFWTEGTDAVPELGDWLCEPLSPRVFGRAVELVLRVHQPRWETWGQRVEELEMRAVASQRTVERWRSEQVALPKLSNLLAFRSPLLDPRDGTVTLKSILPEGAAGDRALHVLRVGRLLTDIRKHLAMWMDDMQAEATERLFSNWAKETRAVLGDPEQLAGLAEVTAAMLREDVGPVLYDRGAAIWRSALGATDAPAAADALGARAQEARQTGSCKPLECLQGLSLLDPSPLLVGFVRARLGAPRPLAAEGVDPWLVLRTEWLMVAMTEAALAAVLPGLLLHSGRQLPPRAPSESTRALARSLQASGRQVVRQHGDPGPPPMQWVAFALQFSQELGVSFDPQGLADSLNSGMAAAAVPGLMERHLDDETVSRHGHLAVHRAARLSGERDTRGAMRWLKPWSKARGAKPWSERVLAAEVLAGVGHWVLDTLHAAWDSEEWRDLDQLIEDQELNDAELQQVRSAWDGALGASQDGLETADRQLARMNKLLARHPKEAGTVEALAVLLPLAVRLDTWEHDIHTAHYPDELEPVEVQFARSGPLVDELLDALTRLPSNGTAWALLAGWQLRNGEDARLTLKKAEHFGGGVVLQRFRAHLERDGWIDPERR